MKGIKENDFYLFTSKGCPGLTLTSRHTLRNYYNQSIKHLNLDKDLTWYSWKHSGVVKAYKSGIDIKALQRQGRWHSVDMVDRYLKSLGLVENKDFTNVMNLVEI